VFARQDAKDGCFFSLLFWAFAREVLFFIGLRLRRAVWVLGKIVLLAIE